MSFFNYLLLTLAFLPVWLKTFCCKQNNNSFKAVVRERAWKYALLSLADVEANYFMIKAYSMTLITTIQVLVYSVPNSMEPEFKLFFTQVIDAFILPITVFLSYLLLKHTFRYNQIVAVASALLGCALIILADLMVKNTDGKIIQIIF